MPNVSDILVRNKSVLVLFILHTFFSCSAACCKEHRSQNCEISKKAPRCSEEPQQSTSGIEFPTQDTVSPEVLKKLSKFCGKVN